MGLAVQPVRAATTAIPKELVQVLATADLTFEGQWVPIPHPRAITYNSTDDKLIVTDANVLDGDPALFNNANVWEFTRKLDLTDTWNISTKQKDTDGNLVDNPDGFSDGPAGVAYNPADGGHLYFLNAHGGWFVQEVLFGANGQFGDADDVRLPRFKVNKLTNDSEDIAFAMTPDLRPGESGLQPTLFIAAGHESDTPDTGNQVFILQPGPNGIFDGPPTGPNDPDNLLAGGDDVMTQFATGPLDQIDLEAVAYFKPPWADEAHLFMTSRYKYDRVDPPRADPFVTEVTLDGTFVNEYPLQTNAGGHIRGLRPSGIVIAPSSNIPSAYSMYISDRGPGVFTDPSSNAGRIFEWRITDAILVTNPGPRSSLEGDAVSLPITATDPEGDPIAYGATGLPAGLSINISTGLISGTVAAGAAGLSTVTVTASNANGSGSATFTWIITDPSAPPPPTFLEVAMTIGSDDAEEASGGTVNVGSSDLELVNEGGDIQTVGLRFPGTGVPAGVTVTNAWIRFQVDEATSVATSLTIHAQAADNAATFATATNNITSRARTAASVGWTPPAWPTVGAAGADQATPNLAALMQEVINRPGWTGDAIAFIITGTGKRVAQSYEGGLGLTPTLHIEYTTGPPNTPPVLTNPGDQSNDEGGVVSLALSATDADGHPLTYGASGLPPGLTINTSTGLISGTISSSAASGSPYTVAATAGDGIATDSEIFVWTVTDVTAPVLTNPGAQSNDEGDVVSLALAATDADGDPLTYGASGLPPGLSIDTSTGVISGTLSSTAASGSPYTVMVSAGDGSATDSELFSWTATNPAPVVTNPGAQSNDEGDVVSLQIVASDSDGDTLTYGALGLPPGLSVDTSTGVILGTVQAGASAGSSYPVTVTAADGASGDSQAFLWTIQPPGPNNAPVLANPGDQSNDEADVVNLALSAADADGDTLTYGESGLPPGLSINTSTGVISGTLSSTAASGGPYPVTVTATDGTDTDSESFTWFVTNPAPVVTNPGAQSNIEGDVVSLPITATDPDGDGMPYSALGLPPGLSIDSSTGVISGTVASGAAAGSPYSVTVTADDGTTTDSETFTWTITVGTPTTITIPVATSSDDAEESSGGAVDLNSSDLELVTESSVQTVGIRFTGVTVPSGAIILGASIQFTVDEVTTGATSLTIQGQAADNPATFQAVSGNVSSRSRTSAAVGWVPAPWSTVGQAGPDQRTPDLAAVVQEIINRPGWASGNAIVFAITGSGRRTAEAWDGTADPILRIDYLSEGGPVNHPPVVTNPGAQSSAEGDPVSLQIVASDSDGDTLTYSATGLPPGLTISTSTSLISGTLDAGASSGSPYTTEVTASDGSLSDTESFTWTIGVGGGPITFVAGASNKGRVTTLMIAKPVGTASGDFLIAAVAARLAPAVTPPSGWTMVQDQTDPSSALRQVMFWKVAGASEPSSYTFTLDTGRGVAGVIVAYRGVSGINASAGQANGSSISIAAPGASAAANDSVEVGFFSLATFASIAPPAGMVERAEDGRSAGGSSSHVTIEVADAVVGSGAIEPSSATASSAAANVGQVVVLTP